jgi:hypothetical protein
LSPAAGKALVYVIRGAHQSTSTNAPELVKIDNEPWGSLRRGHYLVAQMEPGRHELFVAGSTGSYEINLVPGKTHYYGCIQLGYRHEFDFRRLSEARGKKQIRIYTLSPDNKLAHTLVAGTQHALPTVKPASPSLPPVTASSLDFGSYHALVIGINNYQTLPKLRTASNDASSMASLLQERYGFKVRLLLDATRADILRSINVYRQTLTLRDNLLIYYAGHGWLDEDADMGYWLPVDAGEQDPTNWISNGSITAALRAMLAKHVLVIADSCYSGKLARGINIRLRASDYYERICRKKARTVMASGGLEPVSDRGHKGEHSVFASALIEALEENQDILDATLLFSKIRRPVVLNSDQTPEYSDIRKAGHDGGDFLFVPIK